MEWVETDAVQEEVRFLELWRTRELPGFGIFIDSWLILRSIRSYLLSTNVQLGATYKVAQASTNAYANAYKVAAGFINAQPDEVYLKII